MAQISIIQKSDITEAGRFDAEYFKPEYLENLSTIKRHNIKPLSFFIKDGYRVVYESTEILSKEESRKQQTVNFLQANDINGYFLEDKLKQVKYSDWEKYPKGRIKTGEILIEVKGNAEKIALVPNNYPLNTLVTGSLYKFTPVNISGEFLLIWLTCKYGENLKSKLKRNLMVHFIGRDDLHNIPVPILSKSFQSEIEKIVKEAHQKQSQSKQLYQEAERILLTELGLVGHQPQHQLTFSATKNEVQQAQRFDAEYFQPKALQLRCFFENKKSVKVKDAITTPLVSGSTPKVGGDGYIKNGKIKFIRAVNLNNLEVHYENVLFIKDTIHRKMLKRSQLKTNDVIFSIAGVIGRCAVIDDNIGQANINQALAIVRLNQKIFNPYYVALFFSSKYGNQYVNDISRPVAQTNLNLTELSNIHIPLLSIQIQQQIAEKITLSHQLRKASKELLELAKTKVEQEIERS